MTYEARNLFLVAKAIQEDVHGTVGPPEEGLLAETQRVLPVSIVRNTRGYIERVVNQINGCYEKGWYDGCAVMTRRLLETLIIETFEKHSLSAKIKDANGDFFHLKGLVDACLAEPTWSLSRGPRQAMPKLKTIGDKSAHGRRYIAQRGDIDPLLVDVRDVVQELVSLARLK